MAVHHRKGSTAGSIYISPALTHQTLSLLSSQAAKSFLSQLPGSRHTDHPHHPRPTCTPPQTCTWIDFSPWSCQSLLDS